MTRTIRHRRGVALLWVTLFLIVFIGFLGLAMDTAWVMLVHHQLQNAADAAALAGAPHVRANQGQARLSAQELAAANVGGTQGAGLIPLQVDLNNGNTPTGDIVLGRFIPASGVFTPNTTNPNAVRVNAKRTTGSVGGSQPLFFGPGFGTSAAEASRTATAIIAGGLGAGLLVLDPVGSAALELQGGPDLQVLNGVIHVNSTSSTAVTLGGSWTLTGEEMNITGAMTNPPTSLPVNMGVPPLPDPLAHLVAPDMTGMPVYGDIFNPGTVTLQPGHYPNGMRMTSNGNNVTCMPGTYVIGTPGASNQRGFVIQGGTFTANGCTFYIAAGAVDLTANANITITPPPLDQGHYYEHVTIFQSRTNFSDASIWANNASNIEGTLYFPGQPNADPPAGYQFDLNGGGFGQGVQVICYRMRLGGDANLNIFFDGWWPGPLTSRVYLVE